MEQRVEQTPAYTARAKRVSSSDFKNNYGKYIKEIQESGEPIDITKNGNVIFTVVPRKKPDKQALLDSLVGIIPDTGQTKESVREERLQGKYGLVD